MPPANRRRAERRGRTAEILAALFMMMKGYRPLAWRLKTSRGEIDLIMKSGRRIVFVEVRRLAPISIKAWPRLHPTRHSACSMPLVCG